MKRVNQLLTPVAVFASLLIFTTGFAQKPADNRELEMIPDEKTESYLLDNMRVDKETGVPVALYRMDYAVRAAAPEAMAEQFLAENWRLLKLQHDISGLKHASTRETPGGYHVRYQQYVNNIPVYNATLVVNIDRQNRVNFVMNGYTPGINLNNFNITISPDRAKQIALKYLAIDSKIHFEKVETVIYHNKGTSRLAQKVNIVPAEELFGDWEILVDAKSGEIFRVQDKALYGDSRKKNGGSGWVFDPDPLTTSGATYGDPGFSDNNDNDSDSLTAQIVEIVLLDLIYSGGQYHLDGPYANIEDFEGPFNGQFSQTDSIYHYTRFPDDFEAVNVYYHLDKSMRYINQTLGFNLMPFQYAGGVQGDPHGLNGADNSHYISSTGQIAWGEGGVDDAEDADVIFHELGHGIHDWITNGNLSQVEGLSEGCGDYWAASHNRSFGMWQPSDPQYYWVFQWDGHNPFWPGRVTNYPNLYPGGLVGQIHTDGQIWASTLMQIYDDIGRFACDSDFLEALSMTNSNSNQNDAAQAFVQADINLFGGANLSSIEQHFTARGYTVTIPAPSITHIPLNDTEDINGPYPVLADITTGFQLDTVLLIYGTEGVFSDTVEMTPVANKAMYSADIQGIGSAANYNYYIFAADTAGFASTDPGGAPVNYHQFYAGPDTVYPVITHTPLQDQAYIRWPATVRATITDNLGIASAIVNYYVNDPANMGSFTLTDQGGGIYSGIFNIDTTAISIGDSVFYRITATDSSVAGNVTNHPVSGFHMFNIIETRGLVLIVDDDPGSEKIVSSVKGTFLRPESRLRASASSMERWLTDMGYTVTVVDLAGSLTAIWEEYSLVINASGDNIGPIDDPAYRAKWENFVTDPEHKYIIEGGEVGYVAASFPGYPGFAANVIHSDDWDGDNSGPMPLRAPYVNHPIATFPNLLPTSLVLNYVYWGDQDSQNNLFGAFVVYGTTDEPDNAGVLVFDNNTNPLSAQAVYYAFNMDALVDTVAAKNLLENTAEFLLTSETPAIPAPPANLTVIDSSGRVVLEWAHSQADYFNIYKSTDGTTFNVVDTSHTNAYTDSAVTALNTYHFYITAMKNNLESDPSDTVTVTVQLVSISNLGKGIPLSYALQQNYPNPFNPETMIKYQIPQSSHVKLEIYNLLGQKVRTLVDRNQAASYYAVKWDGLNDRGRKVASGLYIYRIEAGDFTRTHKMLLLK